MSTYGGHDTSFLAVLGAKNHSRYRTVTGITTYQMELERKKKQEYIVYTTAISGWWFKGSECIRKKGAERARD
jgi:hypothetical protein